DAVPPALTISSTTCWAGPVATPSPSSEAPRSFTTTFAPAAASEIAMPRPMPRPAPVTSAVLPSSSLAMSVLLRARACERAAQQPTGVRAGVLALAQQDLAVDHRGRDPPGALDQPLGARGQVAHHLRQLGRDGVGVEDHEVGGHALADQAAVGEAPVAGRDEGEHAHRLLEGQGLP